MNVNQNSFLVLIFILPMWMNFLLRTLAWQTLLEKTGVINSILSTLHLPALNIINTPSAIVLGMVYNFCLLWYCLFIMYWSRSTRA